MPDHRGIRWDATTRGFWPKVISDDKGTRLRMMAAVNTPEGKLLASDGKRIVGQVFYEGLSTLGNTGLIDHIRTQRQIGRGMWLGSFSSSAMYDQNGKEVSQSITLAENPDSRTMDRFRTGCFWTWSRKSGRLNVARVVWTRARGEGLG